MYLLTSVFCQDLGVLAHVISLVGRDLAHVISLVGTCDQSCWPQLVKSFFFYPWTGLGRQGVRSSSDHS